MQLKLRKFIKEYNKKHNTTILITSHYMADISSLCKRVILINNGKILYDGELSKLSEKISHFKVIKVSVGNSNQSFKKILSKFNSVNVTGEGSKYTIRVKKEEIISIMTYLMNQVHVLDLTIEDPSIEAVIDQVYREGL